MRLGLFVLLYLCISFSLYAGGIKGRVVSQQNEGLSFASVFVKGTSIGTLCNDEGFYELKLQAGTYTLGFQYIGYKTQYTAITVSDELKEINIKLEEDRFTLSEVKISATAEDPAYPIMRQAIARRRTYLVEAKEYQCRAYLKGMQRLTKVPKRVLMVKVPEDIKPGIIYLSESLSELSFRLPDQIKEKMISSKVSGNNRSFSFNRAGAIKFSLYEPLINSFGLSERGFVSPLSSTAFSYYKFKLEGESKENGQTIYKIAIIPLRKSDPVFRGHIYIVKDSWRLHSTDILVNKDAGVEFVDTLYIKQQYAPKQGGVWMPTTQRFIFQFEAFGFKGNGYFVASYSNYKVNSTYSASFYEQEQAAVLKDEVVPQVRKVPKHKPVITKSKKDSALFSEKYFNREVMSVAKNANKTADAVWDSLRPIPLTDEEKIDYHTKDSARVVEESKPYRDSMDRINNQFGLLDFLMTGYDYSRSYERLYYSVDPPLTIIQYNTVEGVVINPRLSITKEYDNNTHKFLTPQLRYGFASQRLYGRLSAGWHFDPVKESEVEIEGGNFASQFNEQEPISPFINTVYTLFDRSNYLKLYEKSYLNAQYRSELWNGFKINARVEYAQRSNLFNNTDFSFSGHNNSFTANQPVSAELPVTKFSAHPSLITKLQFAFVFAQRYISRPDHKVKFRSKYPVLLVDYKKAIPISSLAPDFDLVALSARQSFDVGLLGDQNWRVGAGLFLNSSRLYFMDYHHFNGNQTLFSLRGFGGLQLLDYYAYSTSDKFVQAQVNHHFNGFVLNKIPLIRKLKWQEVVTFNYLKTPLSPQYTELGLGLEHIFKFLRADYFMSFSNGSFAAQGIRIGFGY